MEFSLRSDIFGYVTEKYGTEPEYLWLKDPNSAVLRHSDNKKWYGIAMVVAKSKLGLDGDGKIDILNVKCDPLFIGSEFMPEGILPAYHMNKKHWATIPLDGSVDIKIIKALLDSSYRLTENKNKHK